jgi:hypothetical protein
MLYRPLWLPLPVVTLLVSLKFNKKPGNVESNLDMHRLRNLFSTLKAFRTRYRSGQFIMDLISQISRELRLGAWDVNGKSGDSDRPMEGESESEALIKAAAMIDEGIRHDASGSSDR